MIEEEQAVREQEESPAVEAPVDEHEAKRQALREEVKKQEEARKAVPEPVAKPAFVQGTLKCKAQPAILQRVLSAGTVLEEEIVPFYFTEEGCRVRFMNQSHTRMLDAFISSDDFDEYECEGEVRIGLAMTPKKKKDAPPSIDKFVSRAKTGISFEVAGGNLLVGVENDDRVANYELHYFEAPPLSKVPKIKYTVRLSMDRTSMGESIKDALQIATFAEFTATEGTISIFAKGDAGKVTIPFGEGTMFPVDLTIDAPAKVMYDIEVFNDMIDTLGAEEIVFEYARNTPCKISAKIVDTEIDLASQNGSQMAFYLTPRIANDEERTKALKDGKKMAEQKKAEEDAAAAKPSGQ